MKESRRVESAEEGTARTGAFHLVSSFGPESHEVESMAQQVEEGRATPLYEFAQGQVDYGADQETPPRIFLVYEDGSREPWNGGTFDHTNVSSIEFVNSGPGLSPEDTVIIRHGGGSETKGKYGRGTSVTLAYLTDHGMPVDVESNFQGKPWKASTALKKTESGVTSTLVVDGQWLDGQSNQTTFRVQNPDAVFLDQLDGFANQFLPANPNYPDALLVEKNPTARPLLLDQSVGKGRIRCLTGVVDWEKQTDNVYVDGLKVKEYRHQFLFPWSFEGFRGESYPLNVERSHDSRSVGSGDPLPLIQTALRHCLDPQIFESLLDAAVQQKYSRFLPGEISQYNGHLSEELLKFTPETLALLRGIWEKKFGPDVLMAHDGQMKDRFEEKYPETRCVLVLGEMYAWLKETGIATAESKLQIDKVDTISPTESITVEYAQSADRLERLFEEAGEALADVQLVEEAGEKKVIVRLPYAIVKDADFYNRKKPGAHWIRVASVIAEAENLGLEVVAYAGTKKTTLDIKTKRSYRNEQAFTTTVSALSGESDGPCPFEGPNGGTIITMTGPALQSFEPPPSLAASLEDLAKRKLKEKEDEVTRRTAMIPRRQSRAARLEKKLSGISRRDLLRAGGALAGVAIGATVLEKSGVLNAFEQQSTKLLDQMSSPDFHLDGATKEAIGSGVSPLGVHHIDFENTEGERQERKDIRIESGDPERGIDGYYREFTGTQLVQTSFGGRAEWISPEKYTVVPVSTTVPEHFVTRILRPINGEARLSIRQGEVVVAAVSSEGKSIEILRDPHLGNYVLRGFSSEVSIYTELDPQGLELLDQPVNRERQPLVDAKDLEAHWQKVIATLRADTHLDNRQKAAIILADWGDRYYYSDRSSLDEQVTGFSIEAIAAKIINTQEGICNTAATGYVALLRSVDVPARTVSGWRIQADGSSGPHMWTEFWDGNSWVLVESLFGSKQDPDLEKRINFASKPMSSRPSTSPKPWTMPGTDSTANFLAEQKEVVDQYRNDLAKLGGPDEPGVSEPDSSFKEAVKATGWTALGAGATRFFDRWRSRRSSEKPDDSKEV